MGKTSINLYSVRRLDGSMREILERVETAGYEGVQFAGGFRDASPDEVAEQVSEFSLAMTPPHIGYTTIKEDFDEIIDTYRDTLGADGVVIPHLDGTHFESREAVDDTATDLSSLADELSDHEMTLHYHNHAHEFTDLGDENGFSRFIEAVDCIGIELDVGWALLGGVDPAAMIRQYGEQIDQLHMKDMDKASEEYREIGDGDVDMATCMQAGYDVGVEWFIYEHDDPDNPAESIDVGASVLNDLRGDRRN